MRRVLRHADPLRPRDHGLHRDEVDRRALPLERHDVAAVHAEPDGHLARGDQRGEQHVALPHVRLERREPAEVIHPLVRAPHLDERRHPLDVGRFDSDAPLPLRIREALIRRRDLGALHLRRVVSDDEEVQAIGEPRAVCGNGRGRKVRKVRRVELRNQFLARQHLHLRAVGLDCVHGMPPGLALGDCAPHHLVRQRSPELHLDAVLLLERAGERRGLGRRERRVEDEPPLAPGPLEKPGVAIGATIQEDAVVALP